MTKPARVGRRTFIKLLAGVAAVIGAPVHGASRGDPSVSERVPRDAAAWVRRFRSQESARRIGRAYLLGQRDEADVGVLYRRLSAGLPPRRGSEAPDWGRLIRADFAQGNTVLVNGWLLSRTEARLCALTALS